MRRAVVLLLLGLCLDGPALGAQSIGRMIADDFSWAAGDVWAVFTSPAHGQTRDYVTAGAVLAGSALLSPLDDDVDRWALANRDRGLLHGLGAVRSGGAFYSINKGTPYVLGLYAVGLATKHRGLRDGIMGCGSAYAANTTARHQVIYRALGRNRPDTMRHRPSGTAGAPAVQGDQYVFSVPSDGWGATSFPGGHVATVATCASFFANRYGAAYADPALVALVLAMGMGRLADRGHWLSDQTVGIAFGYAVGREVARRQRERLAREREENAPDLAAAELASRGFRVGWQITW